MANGLEHDVREPSDRWSALILILLFYAATTAQTVMPSLLLQPIKEEFGMSDSRAVFVMSVSYGLVFVIASMPLGLVSDRVNRRLLLLFMGALSAVAFGLQAAAMTVLLLLAARVGVGIGHAGFYPAGVSFLSDKFGPSRRTAVMALLGVSSSIGSWTSFSIGGAMVDAYGWRTATLGCAICCLAITVLFFLFSREPVRGGLDGPVADTAEYPGLAVAMKLVWDRPSVFHTVVGTLLVSFWGWGISWWLPALLNRSYGMEIGRAGELVGPIHGIVGILAGLGSAAFFVRFSRRDVRAPLLFLVFGATICTIFTVAMVFAESGFQTIILVWLYLPLLYSYNGPSHSVVIAVVPPNMRGQVLALKFLGVIIASTMLAPQAVGLMSDWLATTIPNPKESLRWALLPISLTGFLSAFHFWLAARHVRTDIARLQDREDDSIPQEIGALYAEPAG